jgi:hypothetical protein
MKSILVIPFHDWRKIIKEGFRTRDAHFIESFGKVEGLQTIVINRPITVLEILATKKPKKIEGEILLREKGFTLYKVADQTFVIDCISQDLIGHFFKKHAWYINAYAHKSYLRFIEKSLAFLNAQSFSVLSQNVFSHRLITELSSEVKVFDAWDNFNLIDDYFYIENEVKQAYKSLSENTDFWITNSTDNVNYFLSQFSSLKIHLIPNGLDLKRFDPTNDYSIPKDIERIQHPIVGFGGKITQTIDVEILNYAIRENPDVSFVLVGQVLDKKVFSAIHKSPNVHYLGDKFYDEYPNYVNAFDICLVPYYIDEHKKSGTNPIKVYEYLALQKKVIGTNGNGLENLGDYVYLINTKEELSQEIKRGITNEKDCMDLNQNSWMTKVKEFLHFTET